MDIFTTSDGQVQFGYEDDFVGGITVVVPEALVVSSPKDGHVEVRLTAEHFGEFVGHAAKEELIRRIRQCDPGDVMERLVLGPFASAGT